MQGGRGDSQEYSILKQETLILKTRCTSEMPAVQGDQAPSARTGLHEGRWINFWGTESRNDGARKSREMPTSLDDGVAHKAFVFRKENSEMGVYPYKKKGETACGDRGKGNKTILKQYLQSQERPALPPMFK